MSFWIGANNPTKNDVDIITMMGLQRGSCARENIQTNKLDGTLPFTLQN